MATQLNREKYGSAVPALLDEMLRRIFRPLPKMSLLEWAESYRRWENGLSYRASETPHIREILEAYSDPAIEEIAIIKPTQIGLTDGLYVNAVGYHVHHDPRHVMIVTPTAEEAKKWSKKKLEPMVQATPEIRGALKEGARKSSDTILEKTFAGGSIGIIGANSPRGFRMVTMGTVLSDDIDGWERTAGKGESDEGDQTSLIRRRVERLPDRKLVWGSSPKGSPETSRIYGLYHDMDRHGVFHVPCLHCGTMQVLEWGGEGEKHGLKWESEKVEKGYKPKQGEVLRKERVHRPATAYYTCVNGCRIEEKDKPDMESAGQYLADDGLPVRRPGVHSVGYWLRGALTITLPGSEWPKLVKEFLKVVDDPSKLMVFWNTVLALPWEKRGESPDWERLYERREQRPLGIVPKGVDFLTAGVDVQKSWVEGYVWGWGWDRESWLVDHFVIDGTIGDQLVKAALTEQIRKAYPREEGGELPLAGIAVDTGHDQTEVAMWHKAAPDPRVMLIKGDHWKNWSVIIGTPTKNEVTYQGSKKFGFMLWPMGSALIKQETYGFLRLGQGGEGFPPGWIHLPLVDDEVCQQLCAEDLVTETDRNGFPVRRWKKNRDRNEGLDCRSMARAAAERHGLSRMIGPKPEAQGPRRSRGDDDSGGPQQRGSWLGRGPDRGSSGRGKWLKR